MLPPVGSALPLSELLPAEGDIPPEPPPDPTISRSDRLRQHKEVLIVNGLQHLLSTNTRGVLYTDRDKGVEFCADTGSPISLISRRCLQENFPDLKAYDTPDGKRISLSGIGPGPQTGQYVQFPVRLRTLEKRILSFDAEVYIIDHLSCGILLGVSFLKPNNINIIWGKGTKQRDHLEVDGEAVAISTEPKVLKTKKALIYASHATTIPPQMGINLATYHRELPPSANGYIIKPYVQADLAVQQFGTLIRGMVDPDTSYLPYANFGNQPIHIPKGTKLGLLEICPVSVPTNHEVYLGLSEVFQGLPDIAVETYGKHPEGFPYLVTPPLEPTDLSKANISDHWGEDYKNKICQILRDNMSLFRDELGCFNDGITMPIPFRPDADMSGLKQVAYNLSQKDRDGMDSVLDPLRTAGVVEEVPLGKPSPAASPAFVVWKDGKPRVVVDLRRINTKLFIDAYPLPRQDTVLQALGGGAVFSSVDMVKSFFQQPIAEEDRWKTAFVTPHRGQEQLTRATMGLAVSPSFFQHRMEQLFRPYLWKFVVVYIDDSIIFSSTKEQHLIDLRLALELLRNSGVTLSLSKCAFAQPSIKALGHYVSRLGLSTVPEKIEAIRALRFPETLDQLETGLGFFGYYRKFVRHYAHLAKPLQDLKTRRLKGSPIKRPGRSNFARGKSLDMGNNEEAYRQSWEDLKEALCTATELAFPNFDLPFILYTDGSKEKGFGVALHQIQYDPEHPEGVERPILYLSKSLSTSEENYWPTELETGALVWALEKLPQFLDHGHLTVYTDHQAIRDAFQDQGPAKGKRSPRLTNWRLFLSKYMNRMTIIHRPGKIHKNADGLSRLQTSSADPHLVDKTILETSSTTHLVNTFPIMTSDTPTDTTSETVLTSPTKVTQIHLDKDFKKRLVQELPLDPSLGKLYRNMTRTLELSERKGNKLSTTCHAFLIDPKTRLLFFRDPTEDCTTQERLCIPYSCHEQVLQIAHDNRTHAGINRTYHFLRSQVFIHRLKTLVRDYVFHCPICRQAKPSRNLPKGLLQPITTPSTPMSVLSLDFITGLPLSNQRNDVVLTITDKFTKFLSCLVGKETWRAEDWAQTYYKTFFPTFGLPDAFISDRDSKFTGAFWRHVFELTQVKLAFTTAHHQQANGQAERSNQTLEHALRCALAGKFDQASWESLLPFIQFCLNTSINSSTGYTPYELTFGRPAKSALMELPTSLPKGINDFVQTRTHLHQEAADAIALAQTRMKQYYDAGHSIPVFKDKAYLRISKNNEDGYHLQNQTKLSFQKIGPFDIIRQVGDLAYEIRLPSWLSSIHPVISIEHLEPYYADPYNRPRPDPGPITVNGVRKHIIDRIIGRRVQSIPGKRNRGVYYEVQWLGTDETTWEPAETLRNDVPNLVRKYEAARFSGEH